MFWVLRIFWKERAVTSEQIDALIVVGGYALLLAGAIKIFGLQRVVWFVAVIVALAISIAFKSFGAIVSSPRRY